MLPLFYFFFMEKKRRWAWVLFTDNFAVKPYSYSWQASSLLQMSLDSFSYYYYFAWWHLLLLCIVWQWLQLIFTDLINDLFRPAILWRWIIFTLASLIMLWTWLNCPDSFRWTCECILGQYIDYILSCSFSCRDRKQDCASYRYSFGLLRTFPNNHLSAHALAWERGKSFWYDTH